MKPNNKFELSVEDIDIIETALRAKAGRRGMKILTGEGDVNKYKKEAEEITNLLGRIHDQKVWFRSRDKVYVGG
tara:strand:- start:5243 stop:5464 length:222 start_codon:yes stop_codon:yes gene_type:complete